MTVLKINKVEVLVTALKLENLYFRFFFFTF